MSKHEVGDLINFSRFVKVVKVNDNKESITVVDVKNNEEFEIIGNSLHEDCLNADLVTEEKRVGKTELAEIFSTAFNKPFTVVFTKADGEDRTLRGTLLEHQRLFGRSFVADMDIEDFTKNTRLVTHANLKELILDGIKYKYVS